MSGDEHLRVNWDYNTEPDIARYDVYRSGDLLTYTKIGTTQYTYFNDTNVQNGATYYYKVKAVDTSGNESEFSIITAETYLNITEREYSTSGTSIAAVGDINGDGKPDVILGFPNASTGKGKNKVSGGKVDIYFGGNTTGYPDITLAGENTEDNFGYSLALVDLNNDGYDDLVIGAPLYDAYKTWPVIGTAPDAGKIYVYKGGPQISTTPVLTIDGRWSIGCGGGCYYLLVSEKLGFSIASVGDVNGDGFKDVAIGAPYGGMDRSGSVMIFLGGPSITITTVELIGPGPWEFMGYSVASAGDVNGDGFNDIIAVAPNKESTPNRKTYLLYGGTNILMSDIVFQRRQTGYKIEGSGLNLNGDSYSDIIIDWGMTMDIYYGGPDLNNIPDFVSYRGVYRAGNMDSLNDINKDGYDDLLSSLSGNMVVYFGSSSGENIPDILRSGVNVIGIGDINKDGTNEIIAADADKAYVYSLSPYLTLPEITVSTPKDNEFTESQNIIVKGLVKGNIAKFLVAGQGVPLLPDGTFETQLTLTEGKNVFEIIAVTPDGKIAKRIINITRATLPPLTIEITSPADGATLNQSSVTISGTVSDSTATVIVNNVIAAISGNTFQANVNLAEGPNTITATVFDNYGRTATHSITVNSFTKGTITGIVTDSSTALPLSDVTVTVTDSLNNTYTSTTDVNGAYTVSNVTQGNFTITFTKAGYVTHTESGIISAGQVVILDIQMSPPPPPSPPVTVEITSPADGAVLNSSPVNVAGAVHNTAGTGGTGESRAQSFKPSVSGSLDGVSLILLKVGNPDDNLYIKVTTVRLK